MPTVDAFRCAECRAIFVAPGEAVYECSSCGEPQVADELPARCDSCHLFMAKVGERSCPECESADVEEVAGAWETEDGLFESEAAAKRWVAEAPERERRRRESARRQAEWLERYRRENEEKTAEALPLLRRLRELLGDSAPEMASSVEWAIREAERRPSDSIGALVPCELREMAFVLDIPVQGSTRDEARRVACKIRARLTCDEVRSRFDEIFAAFGSGPLINVVELAKALIPAVEDLRRR